MVRSRRSWAFLAGAGAEPLGMSQGLTLWQTTITITITITITVQIVFSEIVTEALDSGKKELPTSTILSITPGQFSFLTNFLLVDVVALRYFADRRYTLYTVLPFQIFKLVLFYCCTVSYGTKYAFSTKSEIYSHILILSTLSYKNWFV